MIRDFSTTESDSGQVRYVFKAAVARIYAHDVTRAEDVQVDFYDRGQKVSVLTAKRGYLDDSGRMTAEGSARVVTTEGAVLEADKIYWDVDKQKTRRQFGARIVEDDGELETLIKSSHDDFVLKNKPEAPVIIDGDARIPWKDVIDVVNICKKLQIDNIEFALGAADKK